MFLGIDSGSVSMKSVLIDSNGKIIKYVYERNYDLLNTLKIVLKKMEVKDNILGVGVTGTGQEFISKIINADILQPEIVSQYTSAIKLFPNARTIIDIGGQDSKLILVDNKKLIKDCVFNEACAGGTGGIIETIANELNIRIEDIGNLALRSRNDFSFAGKCGIFCRTSVIDRKNKGIPKEDILMGVCRALVNNYFAVLGRGKVLIPEFIFQGATAKNKALVKCFEMNLNSKVNVPEHPDLMGAYGIALITQEEYNKSKFKSKFEGFNLLKKELKTSTYLGDGCSNRCEITQFYSNNKYMSYLKTPKTSCEKCIRNDRGIIKN